MTSKDVIRIPITALASSQWCGIAFASVEDPGSIAFLSGSGMNFFRIPDLFYYDYDFAPETIRSLKIVILQPTFHVRSGIKQISDPGWENVWIRYTTSRFHNTGFRNTFTTEFRGIQQLKIVWNRNHFLIKFCHLWNSKMSLRSASQTTFVLLPFKITMGTPYLILYLHAF
jgi:hypothetical protein